MKSCSSLIVVVAMLGFGGNLEFTKKSLVGAMGSLDRLYDRLYLNRVTHDSKLKGYWLIRGPIMGVNFEEGENWNAQRKPSKSGWDRLKLSLHTTMPFVVEVEGVIDVHYASLTSLLAGLLAQPLCLLYRKHFPPSTSNYGKYTTSWL